MKKYLPYGLFASAIIISFSAELYGIIGFGEIFSGARWHAMFLAGSLGIGKLITAAYLHEHWKNISFSRIYLTAAVVIISLMTSAGIYGFLSSAYQKTAQRESLHNQRVELIKTKKTRFEIQLKTLEGERSQILSNISVLSKSLSTDNQYQTVDRKTGAVLTQIQKTPKKGVETQLNLETQRRETLNSRIDRIVDSIQTYELSVIEAEANNQFASELGPLKYIAELTGVSPNRVVNWFLLAIIFVFDPFAIILVLSAIHTWNLRGVRVENIQTDHPDEDVQGHSLENPEASNRKSEGLRLEDVPGRLDEDMIESPEEEPISQSEPRKVDSKIKRKRGRPKNTTRHSVESIIPSPVLNQSDVDPSKDRTVLETDLNSDVMKHLTDSLPKKKV